MRGHGIEIPVAAGGLAGTPGGVCEHGCRGLTCMRARTHMVAGLGPL
ncbi:hypothetical protein CCP1ISM_110017 [Azospirillaceae bacterium]